MLAVVVIILIVWLVRGGDNSPARPDVGTGAVPAQDSLPEAVEEKRQAIAQAAKERDYEKLAALASKESFNYSFGGPYEGGFAEYLKLEEKNTGVDIFDRITKILSMPYYKQENVYAWPNIFGVNAADWSEDDLAALREIATDKEIESYKTNGSYLGWRIGIREDGEWLFFVAGD